MAGSKSLLRKFEGSLLGALAGDCLGEKFESAEMPVALSGIRVAKFFNAVREGKIGPGDLCYTDDTAMTKVLARSLVENREVDAVDLARKFTAEYHHDPNRGYGIHVGHVFNAVNGAQDVLSPAREQFQGSGSYGNGAAMRVAPVALFYYNDPDKMMQGAKEQSLPTHTHRDGYNGAAVQAAAVREALLAGDNDSSDNSHVPKLDPFIFIENLRQHFTPFEKQGLHPNQNPMYTAALQKIESLLKQSPPPTVSEVVEALGNNVTAPKSVPAAIYSFLRAQEPIEGISAENIFERTVHYAISLGGDTDTIGSMAGAICGAYVGHQNLPDYLVEACEDHDNVRKLAQELFQVTQST